MVARGPPKTEVEGSSPLRVVILSSLKFIFGIFCVLEGLRGGLGRFGRGFGWAFVVGLWWDLICFGGNTRAKWLRFEKM